MNGMRQHGWSRMVADRLLTCPENVPDEELPRSWVSRMGAGTLPDWVTDQKGRSWRVAQIRIAKTGGGHPDVERPKTQPMVRVITMRSCWPRSARLKRPRPRWRRSVRFWSAY